MTKPETCPTCGQPMPTAKLRPNELAVLHILCAAHPEDIDFRGLAEKAGRSPEGAFGRTLTKMVRKGLITRRNGRVKATEAGRSAAA